MVKKKWLVVVCVLIVSITSSFPLTGFACSCVETPGVDEELNRSEAVFTGKVIEMKENIKLNGSRSKSFLFEVKNSYKGITQTEVIIATGLGGGDCGYQFQIGQEYLVYASKSPEYENKLSTIICSRTENINAAKEDLAYLGKGKMPTDKVNLEGELNGSTPYIWGIGVAFIGVASFFIFKKFKRRENDDKKTNH